MFTVVVSGQFGWGGRALCKVCLAICSTPHLFNLLAFLWAAKTLVCLAKGECFENGEMEVITLSTKQIKYPAYPQANHWTSTCTSVSCLISGQSFILADGGECGICEPLPIPLLDPIPTAGCRKGLPNSYRGCLTLTVEFSLKSLSSSCDMWEGHTRSFPMGVFPVPLLDSGIFPAQGLWCSQIHHSCTSSPQPNGKGHPWSTLLESLV